MTQRPQVWISTNWRVWLLAPVLIFLCGRAVSTALLAWVGADATAHPGGIVPQIPAPITLANLLQSWDAQWYLKIVTEGYPRELPLIDGEVTQNQWAFYPLYPLLVKLLTLFGFSFLSASLVISLGTGAAAMVLLYRILSPQAGTFTALLTVTGFSFSLPSLVLGMPYGESLTVLLVLTALWALIHDRPGAFTFFALCLAFTRPITPALATVAGITWILRWRKRNDRPFPSQLRIRWAAASVASAAFFALWPLAPAIATGKWTAYALTQQAWNPNPERWNSWISSLVLFEPAAPYVIAFIAGMTLIAWRAKSWPMALRIWVVVYPVYILGASRITSSIFRYMLVTVAPAWPFPTLSQRADWGMRVALILTVVGLGVGGQLLWITGAWLGPGNLYP